MTSSPTKTILIIYFINSIFAAISVLFVLGDNKQAIALYVIVMIFFINIISKPPNLFSAKPKTAIVKKYMLLMPDARPSH